MGLFTTVLIGVLVFLAGLIILVFSLRWMRRDEVASRLNEYVSEQPVVQPRWSTITATARELRGSLLTRLLLPVVRRIGNFFGRFTPAREYETIRRQLVIAGNPYRLGPREYFGLQIAFLFLGACLAVLILQRGLSQMNFLLAGVLFLCFYLIPVLWLRSKVRARQDKIRKGLPDALDMLSVCATAGLGFDQALQRVSEYWSTPLGIEFGRVIAEMEMGLSRRDALRNLADRLEVSELSSFVSFILQSDQLGMSVADTLHSQASQMRMERRFRAQEQAQKIPTKMLIPLVFLIFPALLAVILGPAIPTLWDVFVNQLR